MTACSPSFLGYLLPAPAILPQQNISQLQSADGAARLIVNTREHIFCEIHEECYVIRITYHSFPLFYSLLSNGNTFEKDREIPRVFLR